MTNIFRGDISERSPVVAEIWEDGAVVGKINDRKTTLLMRCADITSSLTIIIIQSAHRQCPQIATLSEGIYPTNTA